MADALSWFKRNFKLLTRNEPFVWQLGLFERMKSDCFPKQINVPTGCGKTAVIHVWFLALVYDTLRGSRLVPRRLVWIVNNRAVVDQATTEAENLAKVIASPPAELEEVARVVRDLAAVPAAGGCTLAVSTLRGERADNREWSKDPSRPAIIVGTVDMIGSRLLFRGYGDSRKKRARHAGLLGQDSLIVNDEAHLTPAFARLLEDIRAKQGPGAIRVMKLSATPRADSGGFPDDLNADLGNEEFRRRVEAHKVLKLCPTADTRALRAKMLQLAREPHSGGGQRTIVYVNSPEEVGKIADALKKAEGKDNVFLLTGTMRGRERDDLVKTDPFKRFLQPTDNGPPVWGVMTAAGEVGINITAERLVSELDSVDHLLQRFGRLNRFGMGRGEAYVVWVEKAGSDKKRQALDESLMETLAYLQQLPACKGGLDISPAALWQHRPNPRAMSVVADPPRLLPWVLESWALTSINRSEWTVLPALEPWLHGARDDDATTQVAWREDVELLAGAAPEEIEAVLKHHPVLARERLQEPTHRIKRKLSEVAENDAEKREKPVIVLASDGSAEPMPLWRAAEAQLAYSLVLLPPGVGSLKGGMFDTGPGECEYDVADVAGGLKRARFHFKNDNGWTATQIGVKDAVPVPIEEEKLSLAALRKFGKDHGMVLREYVELDSAGDDPDGRPTVGYYSAARPGNRDTFLSIEIHTAAVEKVAAALAERLGLGAREADALVLAAQLHDVGKTREVWQRAAGKPPAGPVAKAPHINWRLLAGYRHELGSLVSAVLPPGTDGETADLALHLVAAHHGWARPHFPNEALDRENIVLSRKIAAETMLRFARLQQRYNPWGLAYLEAIFCAADALASTAEKEAAARA